MGGARRGRRVSPRSRSVTREQVYGRRPVREALRGPREVLELWATERAVASEPWLGDGPRVHVKPDREIGEAAETRDHQGVLAWCEPYRYADAHELANVERPLLACLDQVTDPRNLGAVIRSAEGAGRHRRRRPGPRLGSCDAGRLPVVGRRGRASAGRGRPEPRPLPERDQARRPLDLRRERRGGAGPVDGRPDRRPRARLRRRGQGRPPARPPGLRRDASRSRSPARSSRSTSASPPRCSSTRHGAGETMAEPTLYLFDGHNLLHAGSFEDQRELTDALASFVAMHGARGVLVWDGVGADAEIGPLSVRFATPRRRRARAARRRASRDRGGLSRLVGLRRPRHVGPGGAEAFLRGVPRRPRAAEPNEDAARGSRLLGDSLDDETRERLERMRRGQS